MLRVDVRDRDLCPKVWTVPEDEIEFLADTKISPIDRMQRLREIALSKGEIDEYPSLNQSQDTVLSLTWPDTGERWFEVEEYPLTHFDEWDDVHLSDIEELISGLKKWYAQAEDGKRWGPFFKSDAEYYADEIHGIVVL